MNKLFIIGNLTRDPEMRTTQSGARVCAFTVAVNRRRRPNQNNPDADFFQVAVWGDQGENCSRYLTKGRKVAVCGSVQLNKREWNGKTYADMTVMADSVEFLSPREQAYEPEPGPEGLTEVALPDDELPF